MLIEVVKSKIHRVRVTEANLNYIGSITIDEDLMDAANIIANERVYIVNNNNGARFDTYVIRGERGSGSSVTCATLPVMSSVRRPLRPFMSAAMNVKTTTPTATPDTRRPVWRRADAR